MVHVQQLRAPHVSVLRASMVPESYNSPNVAEHEETTKLGVCRCNMVTGAHLIVSTANFATQPSCKMCDALFTSRLRNVHQVLRFNLQIPTTRLPAILILRTRTSLSSTSLFISLEAWFGFGRQWPAFQRLSSHWCTVCHGNRICIS